MCAVRQRARTHAYLCLCVYRESCPRTLTRPLLTHLPTHSYVCSCRVECTLALACIFKAQLTRARMLTHLRMKRAHGHTLLRALGGVPAHTHSRVCMRRSSRYTSHTLWVCRRYSRCTAYPCLAYGNTHLPLNSERMCAQACTMCQLVSWSAHGR